MQTIVAVRFGQRVASISFPYQHWWSKPQECLDYAKQQCAERGIVYDLFVPWNPCLEFTGKTYDNTSHYL